ncbi:hypothetical protein [Deinococcus metallilatus]|uniref:Aminoglycoside N3'-acetyltransferase n=1 Tax=Deinococcus metallilatus TaxID=1211322 RepID=A0ABR6MS09_9DEIO|nr:hypothetical protein [Deinococcus metallilatus]MBB5294713.1 aminoglycoside N3'-acetyltransferase [Deinococcus metallilatus]
MPEADAIAHADAPRTRESLSANLRALGIGAGETLLVHWPACTTWARGCCCGAR